MGTARYLLEEAGQPLNLQASRTRVRVSRHPSHLQQQLRQVQAARDSRAAETAGKLAIEVRLVQQLLAWLEHAIGTRHCRGTGAELQQGCRSCAAGSSAP